MTDHDRQAHDKLMVAAWRENLLRIVTEAELAFRTVEAGFGDAPEDAREWAAVLDRRLHEVHRRTEALRAHMAHAGNLAQLDAGIFPAGPDELHGDQG